MSSIKREPVVAGESARPAIAKVKTVKKGRSQSVQEVPCNKLIDSWLDWQCKMIAGVHRAIVVRTDTAGQLVAESAYPHSDKKTLLDPESAMMRMVTFLHTSEQPSLVRQNEYLSGDGQGACDYLAVKLKADDEQYIVCLHLSSRSKAQLESVQQLLMWGAVWLSSLQAQSLNSSPNDSPASNSSPSDTSAVNTPDNLLQRIVAANSLYQSSCELANSLKSRFNCERVYLGLRESLSVRVIAISQQASFDRRQQAIRNREAAIEECMDQGCVLSSDNTDNDFLLAAHKRLVEGQSGISVCTVPIIVDDECIGAALLEKSTSDPLSEEEQQSCVQLLEETAPGINLQLKTQAKVLPRAKRWLSTQFKTLTRPDSLRQRWRSLLALVTIVGVLFWPVTHHVSATASVEGADKHLLVALQTGFIKSAQYRAGDLVSAGDVIASFDNHDLLIDRDKWQGELNNIETAFSQALGTRNRAEIGLLKSRKQQISAELALVEKKLARTEIVAPFDGVLVSGDLNQSLGAPVESGQTLFEIASMADFRIVLSVNERDVAAVKPGQDISLRLSALPGHTYQAHVESLLPVSISENGKSFFRVLASVDEVDGQLKPGMRGVAKIDAQRDSRIWVWIHPLVERISLWLWSLA